MRKDTVRIRYEEKKRAKTLLVEAETALLMVACEEFQEYEDTRNTVEDISARFCEVWNELTPKQQDELRPEFWGYAAKYIEAPRKRPDMTYERFVEAYKRRGFIYDPMGIQIRPNETIGFVYRRWPDWTEPVIDRRESLKRAIEWAGQ